MLGVLLDQESLRPADLDMSGLRAAVPDWRCYDGTPPEETGARIREADIVVTNKVVLRERDLAGAQCLRLICVAATGTNNIDLDAAARRGITVSNVPCYATASVAQHVFALLLALTTRLPEYRDAVRSGRWQQSEQFCLLDFPITELAGKTLGIVGYGALGGAVAGLARAFGMHVRVAARPGGPSVPGRVPLDELLLEVDVLSLHCPLTEATRGLIGARELASMRPDALLINTARGGIVEEAALAAALREGHIAGAGVDVLSLEPPREGNPLLALDIPGLIVTPHIAWASRESRQRLVDGLGANITAFLQGHPINIVT